MQRVDIMQHNVLTHTTSRRLTLFLFFFAVLAAAACALAPAAVWAAPAAATAAECGSDDTVLVASADAWIKQETPSANYGSDPILFVKTHGSIKYRTLVQFPLPDVPTGCIVESAILRLYASSWSAGRTLWALQLDGAWSEASVNWGNQPSTTGVSATTSSGSGYIEWNVSSQVQTMLDANAFYGFQLRDALEGNTGAAQPGFEQQFYSREQSENQPQLVISWKVAPDTTAPETTIDSGPALNTTSTEATFTFSADEPGVTFECALDGAAFAPCTSPLPLTGLGLGSHTFEVRAIDAAGNVDPTPASYTWIVEAPGDTPIDTPADTTAPETTIDSGPDLSTASVDATFTFSANEPGATFECSLDGGDFVSCASPTVYTGLAAGQHTFLVRATDAAGNVDDSPASYTWTIEPPANTTPDTTQPDTTQPANETPGGNTPNDGSQDGGNTTNPDGAQPGTDQPDGSQPDSGQPDSGQPDNNPDTSDPSETPGSGDAPTIPSTPEAPRPRIFLPLINR